MQNKYRIIAINGFYDSILIRHYFENEQPEIPRDYKILGKDQRYTGLNEFEPDTVLGICREVYERDIIEYEVQGVKFNGIVKERLGEWVVKTTFNQVSLEAVLKYNKGKIIGSSFVDRDLT